MKLFLPLTIVLAASSSSTRAAAAAATCSAFLPASKNGSGSFGGSRTRTRVTEGGVSTAASLLRLDAIRYGGAGQFRSPPPVPPPPPPPKPEVDAGSGAFDVGEGLRSAADAASNRVHAVEDQVASLLSDIKSQLASLSEGTSGSSSAAGTGGFDLHLPESARAAIGDLRESVSDLLVRVQQQQQQQQGDLGDALHQFESALDALRHQMIDPILAKSGIDVSSLGVGNILDNVPPSVSLLASAAATFAVVSQLLRVASSSSSNADKIKYEFDADSNVPAYPSGKYDPYAARAYFVDGGRLPLVASRAVTIALRSLKFGLSVVQDRIDNKVEEREEQRGRELAELLTTLGPTFIKIGQSLSIRTDLLSPGYVRGLATLQDQVPPFSTSVARDILEEEWGRPISDVLEGPVYLTSEPIAAASLGQVYKAKLKGSGRDVAIKVQRPDIGEQIALDMHLLREFAPIAKRTFNLNTDTVGTVDTWAVGFVSELDYLEEARNAGEFTEQINDTPLGDVVFAPAVVDELSTRRVLVSEWIDGERLDKSDKKDVTVLCSIAMNTYLTMLLELGLLHADPHPGNLLRTPDGKLCILDWGMVTRIDKTLQLALIEHVAHLTSADYEEIPRDLLLLDFIPASQADLIGDSGVVELLAGIYGAWSSGGGAAAINVNDVINQLQDLTAEKGNLFQIPPYFAYIAKSFSVLEGIGLSNDPKYSIINECMPYVSKRLLTDKEKMGPALNTFIFGPEKSKPDRIVDYKRVEQLIEGFGEYTTSASGALLGKDSASKTVLLESAADQFLELVFTEEETPLQDILLEQLAKVISAESRRLYAALRDRSGTLPSGRTVLGTIFDPLGLWRTSPLVQMDDVDERTVETTRKLIALIQKQVQEVAGGNPAFDVTKLDRDEVIAFASILARKVWQRRTGVVKTGNRFARKLLELTANKLDSGERDSRRLSSEEFLSRAATPRLEQEEAGAGQSLATPAKATRSTSTAAPSRTFSKNSSESARLRQARMLLDELHDDEVATTTTAIASGSVEPLEG